jgi:hypothetical protein
VERFFGIAPADHPTAISLCAGIMTAIWNRDRPRYLL